MDNIQVFIITHNRPELLANALHLFIEILRKQTVVD